MFENNQMSDMFSDDQVEMIPILSIDEDESIKTEDLPETVPVLPLRNNVLFPDVVIPISVGRDKSIKAVKKAYKDKNVLQSLLYLLCKKVHPLRKSRHARFFSFDLLNY